MGEPVRYSLREGHEADMAVVVGVSDGRILDSWVHPFDLANFLRMVRFAQTVLDILGLANQVDTPFVKGGPVPVSGLFCAQDAIL